MAHGIQYGKGVIGTHGVGSRRRPDVVLEQGVHWQKRFAGRGRRAIFKSGGGQINFGTELLLAQGHFLVEQYKR
jgi:hypothetical protein